MVRVWVRAPTKRLSPLSTALLPRCSCWWWPGNKTFCSRLGVPPSGTVALVVHLSYAFIFMVEGILYKHIVHYKKIGGLEK